MFDDGYENITNIDISQTSIKAMTELYKDKGTNFKYIQMDVRAMDFPANSFDAVIDKATFDSVIVIIGICSVGKDLILMLVKCWLKFIRFWAIMGSIL